MQRILKFRVWNDIAKDYIRDSTNSICYFNPWTWGAYFADCLKWKGSNLIIFQQFTGLKDKNGREIYEGDILKGQEYIYSKEFLSPLGIKDILLECVYDVTGARFLLNFSRQHSGGYDFHNGMQDRIEIIGNIFQNSSLLT